jgi:hypothetical protein
MASLAKIREIEEQNRRLEELNSRPSIESRLEQLRIEELKLHKSDIELEKRKKDNSGNHRLVEEIDRELAKNREIFEDIDREYHNLKESITNPNPTIDGVFECLQDTIDNLLQFLPQILDSIRSIVLDSSQEFDIPEGLMNKISHYPPELSKLVGMLFKHKYKNCDYDQYENDDEDDDDDDSGIFRKPNPVLDAKKKLKEQESEQRMNYILSLLEPIFFREGISSNYLSDINIFLILVIMNCDKSGIILNSREVSEDLISTFLSDCECEFPQNLLLELDFHIFFFKALRHPRIVKYLEENGIPERNELPKYFLKLESFLGNVQADYIHMKHFQEIVEYLNKISNTFGL